VTGGAARYVDAILAPLGRRVRLATPVEKITRRDSGVELLATGGAPETFDHVIVATHSDQALDLLSDPTDAEREVLGAIAYQPNIATLHTDTRLLPRNRKAWASWNYHRLRHVTDRATVTYHLNRLQGLRSDYEICLTLNRPDAIDPDQMLATFRYDHPVFDTDAVRAQRHAALINGRGGTWFCGAYWGYGFHEDGVQSALRVCEQFGARL
jgi:predicted NAD/FAD-binding protein